MVGNTCLPQCKCRCGSKVSTKRRNKTKNPGGLGVFLEWVNKDPRRPLRISLEDLTGEDEKWSMRNNGHNRLGWTPTTEGYGQDDHGHERYCYDSRDGTRLQGLNVDSDVKRSKK